MRIKYHNILCLLPALCGMSCVMRNVSDGSRLSCSFRKCSPIQYRRKWHMETCTAALRFLKVCYEGRVDEPVRCLPSNRIIFPSLGNFLPMVVSSTRWAVTFQSASTKHDHNHPSVLTVLDSLCLPSPTPNFLLFRPIVVCLAISARQMKGAFSAIV